MQLRGRHLSAESRRAGRVVQTIPRTEPLSYPRVPKAKRWSNTEANPGSVIEGVATSILVRILLESRISRFFQS